MQTAVSTQRKMQYCLKSRRVLLQRCPDAAQQAAASASIHGALSFWGRSHPSKLPPPHIAQKPFSL